MSEQLVIRLASEARQTIHWLIWSDSEKEIIGSGDIENAQALQELTEKAQSRKVICLLPSVDVTLKSVQINGSFTRQMQQALPYMLEDDLAGDVDKLHFSVVAKETDLVHVAICAKNKLQTWLDWLKEADIVCVKFIPEALALPSPEDEKWQVLQLDGQWIVRENLYAGWGCESEMLNSVLQLRLMENPAQIIESYSPMPEKAIGQWQLLDPILPMQLLTEGCIGNNTNLLSGEFKVKKENNLQLAKWKYPAIMMLLLFVIVLVNLFIQGQKAEEQTLIVRKQVEAVYKKAFPNESALRYNRIKRKLKGLSEDLSHSGGDTGFLAMLNDLIPVFKAVPSLQINTLKFNNDKREISLMVSAESFQSFEQLAKSMPEQYELEQGALSNSRSRVSGALTVRMK
ncbi:type II secretion system protein GspL [Psychromonas sp. RZ22]|uniref:type II secretion system protein GspL n=1 Tax=Psychromonas algarum TaxID=2555643 RepID=UPI0010680499|nr:type II secretion system protein GspL [Psychromonas sp. RZ22]TEW53939.1 type II secretion system protein GspL [Psychromonas sp. RZ22]